VDSFEPEIAEDEPLCICKSRSSNHASNASC
jgi:hypothetical protein